MIKYLVTYVVLGLAAMAVYALFGIGGLRFNKRGYDPAKYIDIEMEVIWEKDDTFFDKVAYLGPDWLYRVVLMLAWPITLTSFEFEIARETDKIYEERLKEEG